MVRGILAILGKVGKVGILSAKVFAVVLIDLMIAESVRGKLDGMTFAFGLAVVSGSESFSGVTNPVDKLGAADLTDEV